jgi:peptidoglycan/xylan/chitin deacetylase (PgdA/CDA1 family)
LSSAIECTPVPVLYGAVDDGSDDRWYLEERYLRRQRSARLLPLFYGVKPLVPRSVQMAVRRAMARRQRDAHEARGEFPRWPYEPLLTDRIDARLAALVDACGGDPLPFIGYWPRAHRFAYTITHDVEGPRGLENVGALLEIERRHGVASAWFLVADDYPIEGATVDQIRRAGGEIGLHGLHHDGRLFQNRRQFESQLPRIREVRAAWRVEGFRSPATHRRAEWMPELGTAYDSSFPDTHPFDAQPGGCCSILPYFIGDLVELPITMPQDHTLFELLCEPDIALWRRKAAWVAGRGGLVNVIVHPDYALSADRLRYYDELLSYLRALGGGWCALPRDVARWWRRRTALELALPSVRVGPGDLAEAGAALWWAARVDGGMQIEIGEVEQFEHATPHV